MWMSNILKHTAFRILLIGLFPLFVNCAARNTSVNELAEVIHSYAEKISAASSEDKILEISSENINELEKFADDKTPLSDEDKMTLTNALTGATITVYRQIAKVSGVEEDLTPEEISEIIKEKTEMMMNECETVGDVVSALMEAQSAEFPKKHVNKVER